MEYGFIVMKQNELFFINYVDEKSITLIPSSEPSTKLEDTNITDYSVVYIPKVRGVCDLNGLYINQQIRITYADKIREGKIIKKKKDSIQLDFGSETEWIMFDYKGIPPNILNLEKVTQKKENVYIDSQKQLHSITPENNPEEYYFSIEQQINELLEVMTKNIDTTDYKNLKKINHIISRYIEINTKYYNYQNNYVFTPLSTNPIYDYILHNNSIFQYYSEHVNIKLYNTYSNERYKIRPKMENYDGIDRLLKDDVENYFGIDDSENVFQIETNKDLKYQDVNQINDKNLNSLDLKQNIQGKRYKHTKYVKLLLSNLVEQESVDKYSSNLYSIQTNESFLIDGIIIPDIRTMKNYMNQSTMNVLIHKIHMPNYKRENYILRDLDEKECIYTENNQIMKTNLDIFSIQDLFECLNVTFYNIHDYIKSISVFDLYELSKKNYDLIVGQIDQNIKTYKKENVISILKRDVYPTVSIFLDSILKPNIKEKFYSSSELFHFSLYENHTMVLFDFIKQNLQNKLEVTNDTVKEIMEEFKHMNSQNAPIQYDKVYNTLEDKNLDSIPIFKDNLRDLLKKIKINLSILQLEDKIKAFALTQNDSELEPYKEIILQWVSENTIVDGMYAFVKETKETYVFQNNQWNVYIKKELVKGSDTLNESMNERINEIAKETAFNKLHQTKKFVDRSIYITKAQQINQFHNSKFMKYNKIKRMYSDLYVSSGFKESPHQDMFNKILMVDNIDEKNKFIRQFCELYTIEGEDPYWLYCIDSGVKLVPLFIKTLAYSSNYEDTIQKICYEQGEQQDEYWVDKYSGYTIRKINFIEDEGYTTDGFKIKLREVIPEDLKINTENERNIKTILNSMGIHMEHIPQINNEYIKLVKHIKETPILLYALIFIYIQAYIDTSQINESFHSCKTSFEGYPKINDKTNTSGIEYILCVYKILTNSKKNFKVETFIQYIDKSLVYLPKLKSQLSRYIIKPNKPILKTFNKWDLFLPRLNDIKMKGVNKDYYYVCFYFQKKMNELIEKQEPIIKLSSGRYKTFNYHTNLDKYINQLKQHVKKIDDPLPYELYFYSESTKIQDKFGIAEPSYSLDKIKRIFHKNPQDITDDLKKLNDALYKGLKEPLSNDLIKYAKKKQRLSKTILHNHVTPIPILDTTITLEDVKKYKSIVDTYLTDKRNTNLYVLFSRLEKYTQKRTSVITSQYESEKKMNIILFNLLNDIILMSELNESVDTYDGDDIRKRYLKTLHPTHLINLTNIIKKTYPKLSFEPIEDSIKVHMRKILPFSIQKQNIIYKYYLCKIYKQIKLVSRNIIEHMIKMILSDIMIDSDTIDINNENEKYKEKKTITDAFKQLDDESRNVEFLMKENKLGKWSLGLSKAIYKYDASEYKGELEMDPMEESTEYDDYMDEEE